MSHRLRQTSALLKVGISFWATPVELEAGETKQSAISLPAHQPNLIRNGDFKLRWAQQARPDCWYPSGGAWEGEIIP